MKKKDPLELDEEGMKLAIENVGIWIDTEIRKAKLEAHQELVRQKLIQEEEYRAKTKKYKGLRMITTLLLLTALTVSGYMKYKRGVTFTDVVSESKELFVKAKHELTKEDKPTLEDSAKEQLHDKDKR